MTGTGTQSDPYIPTTLTEFITAVGTAGAYVTLTQDINAADDPAYTGELTELLTINAASIIGRGFAISGVTIRDRAMIYLPSASTTIDGVRFRDWAHKKTTTLDRSIHGSGNAISRCIFSFAVDCYSGNSRLLYNCTFADCAFDISVRDASATRDIILNCTFGRCMAKITGLTIGNSTLHYCTLIRSGFIFSDLEFSASQFIASSTVTFSYVAFLELASTEIQLSGSSYQGSVAAAPEGQSMVVVSGVTQATLDQLKDKDWLTSVGFLP